MADTEKIKIVVEAEDNASQILGRIKSGISGLNSALRQYNSMMSSFNHAMINGVKEMGSAIYDFTSDSIDNFSELSEQHAKTLGAMANDYDKTIESQQKFIENSEKLKQQAIDLAKYGINGQGSLASPTEVSALQTELVKAGISADTMLNTDVVKNVLQFAQANQLDTASAVEFAVSLGSQFGIAPNDWGNMLDKVSHTADMSIIDVSDIVASMKYAGGISSGLDRPLEETLGMISVLGNFGLRGSQAGSGIQALFTRLLTGDTTVISDAMAEVAPEKALKAFYDFSNYAKSAGSEITYDDILNETFTENDITGQLRPMDEVIDTMESVMAELTDEEQAWFAKKLFGLYQMKSAYALINGDDASENSLNEVIKEIQTNSTGTNSNKLAELINSQSGQLQSTRNLIEGIKTELGQMLEPTTLAVLHEVQEYLKDPGNYDINWSNIQSALDESCDAIEDAYGTAIANAVRNLGGLAIDLGQVVEELAPEFVEGFGEVFGDILSGNFFGKDGVSGSWGDMIDNMNESLKDLPPNLQELGEKIVDVIDMFGKLAALNIATTIAQLITSVLQIAMMTINAASVVVNGTGSTTTTTTYDSNGNPTKQSTTTKDGNGNTVVTTTDSKGKTTTTTTKKGTPGSGNNIPGINPGLMNTALTMMLINEISDIIEVANGGISDKSPNAFLKGIDAGTVIGLATGQYKIDNNGTGLWAPDDKIIDGEGNVIAKDNPFGTRIYDYERTLELLDMYKSDPEAGGLLMSEAELSVISSLSESINALNENINGMANQSTSTTNWADVIPGFYAYSEQGQQRAIQNYLDNQISITPQFSMDAPQIQVNVTVDGTGNVLRQTQAILNPGFNTSINNWYQRVASQNGASPK